MRSSLRGPLVVAVSLATVLGLGGVATARGGDPAYPSKAQVDKARAEVTKKTQDVAEIRSELAAAEGAVQAASQEAEIASEAYNGALWRLSEAKKASTRAKKAAAAARKRVTEQRGGIAQLVVQSYQEGTSLNSMSAVLSAQGPQSLMHRTSVVDMGGDAMQADYDRFTLLSAKAAKADTRAARAAKDQTRIAEHARKARDAAAAAASNAAAMEAHVAAQRDQLISALAQAQHTSLKLAGQRQSALEAIARKKAEEAARAKAAAEARAALKAKKAAEARAKAARRDAQDAGKPHKGEPSTPDRPSAGSVGGGGPEAPAPDLTPGPVSGGASAAIAFAKAQLGEWYQWGAAGPSRWDCSGLTMKAWGAGGIGLPHFSGAQFMMGDRINIADARPGDLLFWSFNGKPSGIHHVALYVGGGQFLEAPHTGAQVRYNSIYNWYPNFAVRL